MNLLSAQECGLRENTNLYAYGYFLGLLATSGTETHGTLERVIDPPLEAGKSTYASHLISINSLQFCRRTLTNHDDTSAETLGSQVHDTNLRSDFTNALALVLRLTEKRDEGVSGVRDNGADDTSDVT